MELLLASIPSWGSNWTGWRRATIQKIGGQAHAFRPISPLAFFLKKTEWLQDKDDKQTVRFCPSDRWYIPSIARLGGRHQFSHLMPMPVSVASKLDKNQKLVEALDKLGMPI